MTTQFFTNTGENTLFNKFAGIFAHNAIRHFDALVGYFRASGYFKLRPLLEDVPHLRILVGIDVDTLTAEMHKQGLTLFKGDPEKTIESCLKRFIEDIESANYDQQTEQGILQFIDDLKSEKITLKAHPYKKLHAKIYIFRPDDFNVHSGGEVITGSSNLSEAGLGTSADANYEFNVSLRDYDDIQFATDEFERLWKEAIAILPEAVAQTKNQTYLRDDFTSCEIYRKLLIEYFGKEIEFDPESISDLPTGWKRLNYQMDAVEQGHILLQAHNGFFLSDVVGLGKTVVATLIARKYFFLNGFPEYRSHILIVCPPAVQAIWQETIEQFQVDNVKSITTGSLHKITDPQKYDLVIVDEAHKFRNDTSESYAELQTICKSLCRNGSKKRVILVSATPLNNRPDDIRNQLLLFQDANDSTLDVNIARFFAEASKKYKTLMQERRLGNDDHNDQQIKELYTQIRQKIIEPLTVRRTRGDLMEHREYADDLRKQGIVFPVVKPPENLLYQLAPELNNVYQQSFNRIQNTDGKGLQYARYRLIEYLKPEHRKDYQRPDLITERLAAMMKTLLIKRLDSSFYAFHQSLKRFVRASEMMLKMVADNCIFIASGEQIEKYIMEGREEELLEKLASKQFTDPGIKILTRDDFEPELFGLLEQDFKLLQEMERQWQNIVDNQPDPKLELLLAELSGRLLDTAHNPEKKLVIFSESADTTKYLSEKLKEKNYNILAITAQNRDQQRNTIQQNFDANHLPLDEQKSDIDILIATESLAEGVNLHRANTIVNYDTPWNATRLMQRIGRINRIGSRAKSIYIYNFLPTEEVEDDIGLKSRARIKLQAFHTALGEDSQIYSPDESFESFGLFDKNITENKEISERLAYLMEIRKFRANNPDEFKRIKNLPLKIRNAVADKGLNGNTLCFLRNAKHNAFYQVDADNKVTELSFLEAVRIFENHRKAPSDPLPDTHYQQVQSALAYFETQMQDKIIREQQMPELSSQQRAAIKYLSAFPKLEITDQEENQQLEQAIEWAKLGRSQNLIRDIVKLERSQKKNLTVPSKQLEALIKIIAKHAPNITERNADDRPLELEIIAFPKIIISQSYV